MGAFIPMLIANLLLSPLTVSEEQKAVPMFQCSALSRCLHS